MEEKIKTGIKGLDEMLHGGLYKGSIAVVKGCAGSGKSSVGFQFITRGIEEFGENGLIITFEHFPKQLYRDALSLGFDLKTYEAQKKLKIVFGSPELILKDLEEEGGNFDKIVGEYDIQRVFVDSINHFERITSDSVKLRGVIYAFLNALSRYDATVLVTQEDPCYIGSFEAVSFGLSYIVDVLIQIRHVEVDSTLKKAVFILKTRASSHDERIRELKITDKGVEVGEVFEGREAIITGVSHPTLPAEEALRITKKLITGE